MASKSEPHHIENLSFVPISRAPDTNNTGQLAGFFRHVGLEPQMTIVTIPGKMIDKREPRILAIVMEPSAVPLAPYGCTGEGVSIVCGTPPP